MLFHEIYSSYFNVAAKAIKEACEGTLTDKRFYEIIREKGFGESNLEIPSLLKGGDWMLLDKELKTPVKNPPTMPLTLLQKRWLKSLLDDPRIRLFSVTCEGLEDVSPLYAQDTVCYFDRYSDGDPFKDTQYISNFKTILTAVKEKQNLEIVFNGRLEKEIKCLCFPWNIEYSSKDDKFRVIATDEKDTWTINIGRIISVKVNDRINLSPRLPKATGNSLIMELIDERNALERVMLHFSHLKKETVQLDKERYRITLHYDRDDETEILIRVMSFGPRLKVLSPDRFISQIKQRLKQQQSCGLK